MSPCESSSQRPRGKTFCGLRQSKVCFRDFATRWSTPAKANRARTAYQSEKGKRLKVEPQFTEIRIKGKPARVPSVCVEDKTVVVLGKWLKVASVHDENWLEGPGVREPEAAIAKVKKLRADIFTFGQKVPEVTPRYCYPMEWDNVAAIELTNYTDWWENRLPQETRKNVRRAGKRGAAARIAAFDDALAEGVTRIYNEAPVRQGKRFPKYGLSFAVVKEELSQILVRSEFIGAYFGSELIGFIKMIYMGRTASILSFVSMNQHFDKRPTNLLIAKAVEVACARGMSHLLYGRYTYGKKGSSPLTEFKRRNGFEKVIVPRYYVPLTVKGRLSMALNLHLGLIGMLPGGLVDRLVKLRAAFFE